MKTKFFLGIFISTLIALSMSFNLPIIKIEPDGALISKDIVLNDGEIFKLKTYYSWVHEFKRSDLPSTPVIIRSYEENPYDFEVLKAYSLDQLFYLENRYPIFDGPKKWYFYNQDKIISSISPSPFTKENFRNYYNKLFETGGEQINFFHLLLKSKVSRNALYKYCTNALNSLQYHIPSSVKDDLKNQIFSVKVFLKNFPSRKSELLRYEKDNTIIDKISPWESFAYRRIIHDAIPIAEITEFLDEIEKVLDKDNSKHLKLFQIQINNGDLILSDTINKSIVISSENCSKRIVLPHDQGIQVKMFSEGDKNYYQFERRISDKEFQFLGLYSSYLETIRQPEE